MALLPNAEEFVPQCRFGPDGPYGHDLLLFCDKDLAATLKCSRLSTIIYCICLLFFIIYIFILFFIIDAIVCAGI